MFLQRNKTFQPVLTCVTGALNSLNAGVSFFSTMNCNHARLRIIPANLLTFAMHLNRAFEWKPVSMRWVRIYPLAPKRFCPQELEKKNKTHLNAEIRSGEYPVNNTLAVHRLNESMRVEREVVGKFLRLFLNCTTSRCRQENVETRKMSGVRVTPAWVRAPPNKLMECMGGALTNQRRPSHSL